MNSEKEQRLNSWSRTDGWFRLVWSENIYFLQNGCIVVGDIFDKGVTLMFNPSWTIRMLPKMMACLGAGLSGLWTNYAVTAGIETVIHVCGGEHGCVRQKLSLYQTTAAKSDLSSPIIPMASFNLSQSDHHHAHPVKNKSWNVLLVVRGGPSTRNKLSSSHN